MLPSLSSAFGRSLHINEPRNLLDQLTIASTRNLEKHYRQGIRKWKVLKEKKRTAHEDWYWYTLRYHEIEEAHFGQQRLRQFDRNIQQLAKSYDRYYYLHRLSTACAMLDRETIFQGKYDIHLSPSWFTYLEEQSFFQDPLIEIYYKMWKMLHEPNKEEHFENFMQQLRDTRLETDHIVMRGLYMAGINYTLRKLRQRDQTYRQKALDLYLEAISRKVLLDKGELSPWAFGNVVKLALQLKKYDWVKSFIKEKSTILPDAFREDALNYNLAEVNYITKQFRVAQEHLLQVSFSDLNYYLGARILLAKIYYELEDIEPLLSLISAFTIFLKRNKQISPNIKSSCLNFCEVLFQLVRKNKKRLTVLEKELKEMQLLAERDWLLQQYEQVRR